MSFTPQDLWSRSTSTSTSHHQTQRMSVHPTSMGSSPPHKSTTRLFSLKLRHHHSTVQQVCHFLHRMKRRLWFMSWLRNPKTPPTSTWTTHQLHHRANRRCTSSNTRPRRIGKTSNRLWIMVWLGQQGQLWWTVEVLLVAPSLVAPSLEDRFLVAPSLEVQASRRQADL